MRVITLGKYGALGNNFFRFIHLTSFAKKYNLKLYYSDRKNIDHYFSVDENYFRTYKTPWILNREFFRSVLRAVDKSPRLLKCLNKLNIYLHDHLNNDHNEEQIKLSLQRKHSILFILRDFRSVSSLNCYLKDLRKSIDVKRALTNRIENEYQSIREEYKVLLGIHIRRGDYKNWHNGRYYYNDEVFVKKIKEFLAFKGLKSEEVGIVICSNGYPQMENFFGLNVLYAPRPEEEDLYLMKRCDYIIAPPSTFCSMSSFMGEVPIYFIEDEEITAFEQRLHVCSY